MTPEQFKKEMADIEAETLAIRERNAMMASEMKPCPLRILAATACLLWLGGVVWCVVKLVHMILQ